MPNSMNSEWSIFAEDNFNTMANRARSEVCKDRTQKEQNLKAALARSLMDAQTTAVGEGSLGSRLSPIIRNKNNSYFFLYFKLNIFHHAVNSLSGGGMVATREWLKIIRFCSVFSNNLSLIAELIVCLTIVSRMTSRFSLIGNWVRYSYLCLIYYLKSCLLYSQIVLWHC